MLILRGSWTVAADGFRVGRRQRPQPDREVGGRRGLGRDIAASTAGEGITTVGGEDPGPDGIEMSFEAAKFFPAVHVPQPQSLITTPGEGAVAVGRKSHAKHRGRV